MAPYKTCNICNIEFSKPYNLKRHMSRFHNIILESSVAHFTNDITQITNDTTHFTNDITQITNDTTHFTNDNNDKELSCDNSIKSDEYECHVCKKVFSRQWCLLRHINTCKGIRNPYQCTYCNKTFTHPNSRFSHLKICKMKEVLEKGCSISNTIDNHNGYKEQSQITDGIQNASTIINNKNSIREQVNIETQNNQNFIIVYNHNNIDFSTECIGSHIVQRLIKTAQEAVNSRIITEYSREIFSLPGNQCVKKEDLKSGHSEVHVGDNKWEIQLDKHIYPRLACSVANNMSEYLHSKRDKIRKEIFDKTIRFLDYMSDEGYINTDDKEREKQIKSEYRDLVKELRLIIYSKTKHRNKHKSLHKE